MVSPPTLSRVIPKSFLALSLILELRSATRPKENLLATRQPRVTLLYESNIVTARPRITWLCCRALPRYARPRRSQAPPEPQSDEALAQGLKDRTAKDHKGTS